MQIKKNPKANLESYSKIFMLLGLVLALLVILVLIEKKTYDRAIADLGVANYDEQEEEQVIEIQQVKPPQPKTPPPPTPDKIEVVKDEEKVEETVIESTETSEDEAVVVEEQIEDVVEEEEVIEDVPFAIIEDVPVYPGCKGNKQQLKECLQKKIQKHVARKFNSDLAQDLGLSPGVKRINVMFKIDKNGNISGVRARAPHKRLEAEAIRVIKSLPKMIPGKQRGRPVGVKYSMPIRFQVE